MNISDITGQPDAIEYAGSMLDRYDQLDLSGPSLLEVTGISQHRMATASGLNDYDYQNLSKLSLGLKQLNQLETVSKVPIPAEVMEHFKHIKCHCMMGLFPEIGRAWLTIDSDIYIWTYEHSRDVAYYDGLNHLIVSVGLVKPKPGVFISDVKYLLIITTPIEITVLGVTFGDLTKSVSSSPSRKHDGSTKNRSVAHEDMLVMNKPIFIINTDNIAIRTITGTDDNRIFLGGSDGCLYELCYQAESNWFGKRCKKINHSQGLMSYIVPGFLKVFSEVDPIAKISIDNSRNLLYTLSEKGAIEAWTLGSDSDNTRRIARLSQNDISNYASRILSTVDASAFKPIVALCPLTASDSTELHLLAVTQCGVRLYFATVPLIMPTVQQQQQQQQQQGTPLPAPPQPQNLYLLHVRLPPGYTPNASVGKPKSVRNAYHNEGTVLMVSTPQQDQDLLWSLSSEPFPRCAYLAESTTVVPLNGQVWSIGEVINTNVNANELLPSFLQNAKESKKIVLLTNQGAHIVAILKPFDLLQQLLISCHGPHHEAIKGFFQTQTESQACAACILLACTFSGTEIGMWATQAFLLYGGEPQFGSNYNLMIDQTIQNARAAAAAASQFNFTNYEQQLQQQQQQQGRMNTGLPPQMYMSTPYTRPTSAVQQSLMQHTTTATTSTPYPISPLQNPNFLQQSMMIDPNNVVYSAKHAGLYLHVCRLIRPIWKKKCISLTGSMNYLDCAQILDELYAIKSFIESLPLGNLSGFTQNYNNQSGSGGGHSVYGGQQFGQNAVTQHQRNSVEQAYNEEKKSINALTYFITHTCEVMALWKILCEHQFIQILRSLSQEEQQLFASITFRDLILSGTEVLAILIVSLINTYLNDNASIGSISAKLRDVCPNLYRHEDAVTHKATEILVTSKNCIDTEEQRAKLHTALQLCKDAAPNLPLSSICQQFIAANFQQGVIELCAICASKIDPNDAALHFYRKELASDQEGYIAYTRRRQYYNEIKLMFDQFYQTLCNRNAMPPNSDATLSGTFNGSGTENNNNNNSINANLLRLVALSLQTPDQLLHIAVYEWLLAHNLLSELLDITESSLGEFLSHSVGKNPDNLQLVDILWKYYERNGQHSEATQILDDLASRQSNKIPLNQRIEYLARAVMCMRSDTVGYSAHNGVLLKNLEDKLEIARVQKLLLDDLSDINDSDARDAVQTLNFALYNITDLFTDFAERFDLWECKLTILNCSHHNDPLLIESVWTQILNKELEMPGSSNEKCTRLLTKVQSLAIEYGNSGHCFPIAFLVRELELRCCKLKLKQSPVPDALIRMKIDVDMLLDIYNRMVSMNERIWAAEGNEWHLIESTTRLLEILAEQPYLIPTRNGQRVVLKPLELLYACRTLLNLNPNTKAIVDELNGIEIRLNRIK